MSTTSTHLPLQEGEMVYKIIGPLDINKAKAAFKAYKNIMDDKNIVHLMLSTYSDLEAMALHRVTKKIYRISTVMLGYIDSPREEGVSLYPPSTPLGGQEGALNNKHAMSGYTVRWESKLPRDESFNFEDETRLMPLRDIIILSPEELRTEIISR